MQDKANIVDAEKAKGVIFGLAIPDALGYPTEFMSLSAIKDRCGDAGIRDLPDPALYTDDTQMTVAIAEALVRAGDRDFDAIMDAVRDEFIKWRHSPEDKHVPRDVYPAGVEHMECYVLWTEAGPENAEGCGSAILS